MVMVQSLCRFVVFVQVNSGRLYRGVDNNGNALVDCDPWCSNNHWFFNDPSCTGGGGTTEVDCVNQQDDDGDGDVDVMI